MFSFWRGGITMVVAAVHIFQFLALDSHAQSTSKQIEALKREIYEIQRQHQQQIEELRKKLEELETQKQANQKTPEELASVKEEDRRGQGCLVEEAGGWI